MQYKRPLCQLSYDHILVMVKCCPFLPQVDQLVRVFQVQKRLFFVELLRRVQDVVAAEAPVDLQTRQAEDPDGEERPRDAEDQDPGGDGARGLRVADRRHLDARHLRRSLRVHAQARESAAAARRARRSFVRRFLGRPPTSFAFSSGVAGHLRQVDHSHHRRHLRTLGALSFHDESCSLHRKTLLRKVRLISFTLSLFLSLALTLTLPNTTWLG